MHCLSTYIAVSLAQLGGGLNGIVAWNRSWALTRLPAVPLHP